MLLVTRANFSLTYGTYISVAQARYDERILYRTSESYILKSTAFGTIIGASKIIKINYVRNFIKRWGCSSTGRA